MYPYETWLFIFFGIPLVCLWALFYKTILKYRLALVWITALTVLLGIAMDYTAIHYKIWGWSKACCALPRIRGLPIEEFIFMLLMAVTIETVTIITRDIFLTHHWIMKSRKKRS